MSTPTIEPGLHTSFIKQKMPLWVQRSSVADIKKLRPSALHREVPKAPPAWLNQATQALRQALQASQQRSRASHADLARALKGLKGIIDFAEPLLEEKLKTAFGQSLDVNQSEFVRITYESVPLSLTSITRPRILSLLKAALQNFEHNESFETGTALAPPGAFNWEPAGREVAGTGYTHYQFRYTEKLPITAQAFAETCRELDLGKQYQEHLASFYDSPTKGPQIREKMMQASKDALAVDVHTARIKSEISEAAYQMLLTLLSGHSTPTLDGAPVTYTQLEMLGSTLGEIVIIGAARRSKVERVVVYMPGAPLYPVKEYPSARAFIDDLTISLQTQAYQKLFSRFVPQSDIPAFFKRLNATLFKYDWGKERLEKVFNSEANLRAREAPISGELFAGLYDRHVARAKANARSLAVPTADVDRKAFEELLEHCASWGLDILNVMAFFIPGLDAVMLAVMAAQLCYEINEGFEALSVGDLDSAWAHFESVALNVAFVAVAAAVHGALPTIKPSSLVDSMDRVTLPSGEEKLWKPDIRAYESDAVIASDVQPNAQGQYLMGDKTYIKQGGKFYEQSYDAQTDTWRLKHPNNPDAYQPLLRHNKQGAWQHIHERPLAWDRPTLLRRISHTTDPLTDETLSQIADISGLDDDALRKMHVDHKPPAPQLAETLRQFETERIADEMIEQVRTGQAIANNRYNYVLPLVVDLPRWPVGRAVEVFDGPEPWGKSTLYKATGNQLGASIKVTQAQVAQGQLPDLILEALTEPEIIRLLGAEGARVDAQRGAVFREQLADHGLKRKAVIFETIYKGEEVVDPEAERLRQQIEGISVPAAREILANATEFERAAVASGGRLPLRLAEEGRWFQEVERLNRAYAGLHLESMASNDSETIALQSLHGMPGWPADLRLEVRQGSTTGALLDSIGPVDAPRRKYLVKSERTFQAFDERGEVLNRGARPGNNFFSSLMHALPDDARRDLGVPHVDQHESLRVKIAEGVGDKRQKMSEVLRQSPIKPSDEPPMHLAAQRPGYALARGADTYPGLVAKVRRVYPASSDETALEFVRQQIAAGQSESHVFTLLLQRQAEYDALYFTLRTWVEEAAAPASFSRTRVADNILDCWRSTPFRSQGNFTLDLKGSGLLPELAADFTHVSALEMGHDPVDSVLGNALLRQFPNARGLRLTLTDLSGLSETLGQLQGISELHLEGPQLRYDAEFQKGLDAMPQLEMLSIKGAMDGLDVSRLTKLRALRIIGDTTTWPQGAETLGTLKSLDIKQTNIKTLAPGLFEGHHDVWGDLWLNGGILDREAFTKIFEQMQSHWADLPNVKFTTGAYCAKVLRNVIPQMGFVTHALGEFQQGRVSCRALLDRTHQLHTDNLRLNQQLDAWVNEKATVDTLLGEGTDRDRVAAKVRDAWLRGVRQRYAGLRHGSDAQLVLEGHPSVADLPDLPSLNVEHVQDLRLANTDMSVEQANRLLGKFARLRHLDLSQNSLTELPQAIGELTQLQNLNLSSNDISMTTAAQRYLDGLTNLEELSLNYNPVLRLDVTHLAGLKRLDLDSSAINQWPVGVFNLPALERLDLSHSAITDIPEAAMADQDLMMRKVNLSGCDLSPHAYAQLRSLSANPGDALAGIPRTLVSRGRSGGVPFAFMEEQTQETLQRNLLPPLAPKAEGDDVLAGLRKLDPDLSDEQVDRVIHAYKTRGMDDAQIATRLNTWREQAESLTQRLNAWINVSAYRVDNRIVSSSTRRRAADLILHAWRSPFYEGVLSLPEALDLSVTVLGELPDLPELPAPLSHVQRLDLTGVRFAESGARGFWQAFSEVKVLILDENNLAQLPDGIAGFSQLQRLEAANNDLVSGEAFQQRLDTLTGLEHLGLRNNRLETLNLQALTQLKTVDLARNQLVGVEFEGLTQLRSLDLRNNRLTHLPEVLFDGRFDALLPNMPLEGNSELVHEITHLHSQLYDALTLYVERTGQLPPCFSAEQLEALDIEEHSSGSEPDIDDYSGSDTESETEFAATHIDPWAQGLTPDARAAKELTCDALKAQPGSDEFFAFISRLRSTSDYADHRVALTQRVWTVLDAVRASTELREEFFLRAHSAPGTCPDGYRLLLADMEVKAYEKEALRSAPEAERAEVVFRVGRSMFRSDALENIAQETMAEKPGADQAEIRLAYLKGLRHRLKLPGEPQSMLYEAVSGVGQPELDAAYQRVTALERTPALATSLLTREYWLDYLHSTYADQFTALENDYNQACKRVMARDSALSQELEALDKLARAQKDKTARLQVDLTQRVIDRTLGAEERHGAAAQ